MRRLLLVAGVLGVPVLLQGCVAAVGAGAAGAAAIAYDRRTAGTFIDDTLIELKVYEALRSDPEMQDQTHINVTSYNNVVLLTGEAPNEALRSRAGERAREVPKVRLVHNELAIAAPSSLLARSSDSVITGKVKSQLLNLDVNLAARTKVVTESGVVFLMGISTREESDAATNVARQVGGVQRVVKVFEYLD
ncbi:MAG: BON domain-containing protein [Ectothiorhodospiraceae bacterium]|nr:BON domain-containing protein [Ectothiorhodospiraceae bacterium]